MKAKAQTPQGQVGSARKLSEMDDVTEELSGLGSLLHRPSGNA